MAILDKTVSAIAAAHAQVVTMSTVPVTGDAIQDGREITANNLVIMGGMEQNAVNFVVHVFNIKTVTILTEVA